MGLDVIRGVSKHYKIHAGVAYLALGKKKVDIILGFPHDFLWGRRKRKVEF